MWSKFNCICKAHFDNQIVSCSKIPLGTKTIQLLKFLKCFIIVFITWLMMFVQCNIRSTIASLFTLPTLYNPGNDMWETPIKRVPCLLVFAHLKVTWYLRIFHLPEACLITVLKFIWQLMQALIHVLMSIALHKLKIQTTFYSTIFADFGNLTRLFLLNIIDLQALNGRQAGY